MTASASKSIRIIGCLAPNLQLLQEGGPATWDAAFRWLWPAALGAARDVLERHLPAEVEDVAIQAIEELVEQDLAVTLRQANDFIKEHTSP